MSERLRVTGLRAWREGERLTVLGPDRRALRFEGASADLAEAAIERLSVACTRPQLFAHLEAAAGQPIPSPGPVDELLEALRGIGALRGAGPSSAGPVELSEGGRRVVLAISGAVAAAHAPMLLAAMLQEGWSVRVAVTESALRFVTRESLEAISHAPVVSSLWQRDDRTRAHHIELAEWAELLLVYPASATTLARIARGECSDVVCASAVATRAAVLLAPSMNAAMYRSPAVQRNLETLRGDGFLLLLPTAGVEIAHAPEHRLPMFGPAPLPDDAVAVARAILQERRAAELPTDARGWDALYRRPDAHQLPWSRAQPEAVLAAMFQCVAGPGVRALEVGTGAGSLALALSALGCEVTATEVSGAALELARARPGAAAVRWILDDVCASALEGPFDLIVDRACLHVLPRERHGAWAETLRRLSAPGARIIVMAHDPSEAAAATHGYELPAMRALLAPWCDEVRATPARMEGGLSTSRAAWIFTGVVRRLTPDPPR